MALGSVGVVYGDIGTSPLYAFREAVAAAVESGPVTRDIVLGVLSLILWALIVVVAIKYVSAAAARGQQRRGRHALPDRAGDACARPAHATRLSARGRRRLHVPGQFGDHAGNFRPVGDRRPQARHPRLRPLRRAAHHRRSAWPVRGPEPGNSAGGEFLRTGHGDLVHCDRGRRASCTFATIPACSRPSTRAYAVSFLYGHGRIGLVTLGARVPRGHRRRGALRRSRSFRAQADPDRLVRPGAAGAAASIISVKAPRCSPIPPRSRTRSTGSFPRRCCCPWWCSRPRRRSSRVRP